MMSWITGLTLFTLQSKINFSFMGAFLGVAMMAMFAWGIIVWILGMKTGFIFSLLGAIIFRYAPESTDSGFLSELIG